MIKIKPCKITDAKTLAQTAQVIWREHYVSIIGSEQVEYMLTKFQSVIAIQQQMKLNHQYFLIQSDENTAGYMAIIIQGDNLFISKFYLSSIFRGQGIAKIMLEKIYQLARQNHSKHLELTVNKNNPAYQIYLKLGFEKIDSIQIDIGDGYIMDDYKMVKDIT